MMKLAKVFGESGVSAVHLEDQLHGGKRCGHQSGKVLVPMSEHVSRLIAARMQWDIMGLETLLIARTDAESGKLINGTADGRDHEFILGVETWEGEKQGLSEEIAKAEREGKKGEQINQIEDSWMAGVKLVTFNDGASPPESVLADQLQPSRTTFTARSPLPRQRRNLSSTRARSPAPISRTGRQGSLRRRSWGSKCTGTGTYRGRGRGTTTTRAESRYVLSSTQIQHQLTGNRRQ